MIKSAKYNDLNNRMDILEESINKYLALKNERHTTNEIASNGLQQIITNAAKIILKYLPTILKILPTFIEALKADKTNDNSEKINILSQLNEIGQQVDQIFKT